MKTTRFLRFGVFILALLAALLTAGCGGSEEPEAEDAEELEESENSGETQKTAESEENGGSEETETTDEPAPTMKSQTAQPDAPASEDQNSSGDIEDELEFTLPETVRYVESLSPEQLGLSDGEVGELEIIPKNYIVPVEGLLCSELLVYTKDGATGTNQLVEIILVSRGPERKLYRLDSQTEEPVPLDMAEVPTTDAAVSQPQDSRPAEEDAAQPARNEPDPSGRDQEGEVES